MYLDGLKGAKTSLLLVHAHLKCTHVFRFWHIILGKILKSSTISLITRCKPEESVDNLCEIGMRNCRGKMQVSSILISNYCILIKTRMIYDVGFKIII